MINCKRCKFYYKAHGWYSVCLQEKDVTIPCMVKNYNNQCAYYKVKFPYRQLEMLKRYLNYLLPRG